MKIAPRAAGALVATAHTPKGLALAAALTPRQADLVEIRADALRRHLPRVERAARAIRLPLLLTVRDPAEGGVGDLGPDERAALVERLLPLAAWLDLELRNARAARPLIALAKRRGVRLILSHHDFSGVPSAARCRALARRAAAAGADLFKIAAAPRDPAGLSPLLALLADPGPLPAAAMAMGPLGKAARLLFARCGSALTYGYLDRPNAPGQWDALELRRRIAETA